MPVHAHRDARGQGNAAARRPGLPRSPPCDCRAKGVDVLLLADRIDELV
jgi:hypothetical protein